MFVFVGSHFPNLHSLSCHGLGVRHSQKWTWTPKDSPHGEMDSQYRKSTIGLFCIIYYIEREERMMYLSIPTPLLLFLSRCTTVSALTIVPNYMLQVPK